MTWLPRPVCVTRRCLAGWDGWRENHVAVGAQHVLHVSNLKLLLQRDVLMVLANSFSNEAKASGGGEDMLQSEEHFVNYCSYALALGQSLRIDQTEGALSRRSNTIGWSFGMYKHAKHGKQLLSASNCIMKRPDLQLEPSSWGRHKIFSRLPDIKAPALVVTGALLSARQKRSHLFVLLFSGSTDSHDPGLYYIVLFLGLTWYCLFFAVFHLWPRKKPFVLWTRR